ncbi:hypothetical protein H2199_006628 [Coniosporium tulheliwenetii]|uniref:Uncharacterized protein n=1 Tax=Coniosporium tulheliwenetii TaxID=3383036 RepID=A0ACC2YTW0_9PEZI|nr:hypothetical protein H2199_006628 [Cladosporium sp. JES 115]
MDPAPVDSAVEPANSFIPLIDFSPFLNPPTPTAKQVTAHALLTGFRTAGFIYLRNAGISPQTISRVFDLSASFFRRPQDQKDALAWYSPEANRGYTAQGREKVEKLREEVPDLKESLEIGRDDEVEYPNCWPDRFDDEGKVFRRVMNEFFEECKGLHGQIMRAVALGMGLEEEWFDGLLHYPEVERRVFQERKGQVRAGAHTDYGSITLLFQDDRGGLQVQSPDGTFVDATPILDTIVINAGDLLARWSNDLVKSTKHRVVEPPLKPGEEVGKKYPARYSVAYFCNPNFNKWIDAIPGTFEEEGKKYPGVNSGEYLVQRLAATY